MTNDTRPLSPNTTLATLATTRAGASRVFARHHLDFCCHGNVSIVEACEKKGLDPDAVLAEVLAEERAATPETRWDERPLGELIGHIVLDYHGAHRTELPRLLAMAERVERVHREKPSCPRGLADILAELAGELLVHMEKEEQILFPMIQVGRGQDASGPIQVMETEHRDAAALLEKIRAKTDGYRPPAEACGTWRALYLGLEEFEQDLMTHVHLENHVLFPRALRG